VAKYLCISHLSSSLFEIVFQLQIYTMHNSDFSMDILVSVDKVQPHDSITALKRMGWGLYNY